MATVSYIKDSLCTVHTPVVWGVPERPVYGKGIHILPVTPGKRQTKYDNSVYLDKEPKLEQDLFRISRGNRIVMILFLAVMTAVWALPVYSLIKDSLKVNGIANYTYVLSNQINGVLFY